MGALVKLPVQERKITVTSASTHNSSFFTKPPSDLLSSLKKKNCVSNMENFSPTSHYLAQISLLLEHCTILRKKKKRLIFLDSKVLFKSSSRVIQDKAITSKDKRAPKESKEDR